MANVPFFADLYMNQRFWDIEEKPGECMATFYECTACLRDQDNRAVPDTLLFNRYSTPEATVGAAALLYFGVFGSPPLISSRPNSSWPITFSEYPIGTDSTIQPIITEADSRRGLPWNENDIALGAELHVANAVARLPIAIVMGAEMQLPRIGKVAGAIERHLNTAILEVRWDRVAGVFIAILAGQVIAVAATIFCCRKVILQDPDNFLPIARLMNTAIKHAEGRSIDATAEIAAQISNGGAKGERRWMRYGTRNRDGIYKVDLWHDVENNFPEAKYR